MLFCWWSSILERQQGIHLAICTSALLDEHISKSSIDEDCSLSEGNSSNSSNSSSSDSTLSSVSGSSGTRSEMSEVSSVDSTSIIDDLLGIVAQVHDQIEQAWRKIPFYGGNITYSRFEWRWCIDTLLLSKSSSVRGSRQALAKASMFL